MIIKNINNIITTIIFNNPTRQPKQPLTMPNNILKNILIAGHTITTIIANIIQLLILNIGSIILIF